MKMLAVVQLTLRESLAKKTFMAFFGISTFIGLLFLFALNLDIVDGVKSSVSFFGHPAGKLVNLDKLVIGLEGTIAVLLFTGGLFLSLFATSNQIPNFLQPGNIDLFISKPLSRGQLFVGRFLGAVLIVALNVFYLVLFVFLVLSFKTGIWNWGFLLSGLMIVITFAILYSLMAFLGLLTRSSAFSLMITYTILFFSPLLLQRDKIYALLSGKLYGLLLDGLYYFLPKTAELATLTEKLVANNTIPSFAPLCSSLLFGLFMFSVSLILFHRKNF